MKLGHILLPCAISVWQTPFLILRVALLGNCKTFQRLPIYQCFKRQLINVICIWATEDVNTGESLEECSQLDSQEQHFSKAVVAHLGNAITKFGLLQSIDTQWSFLMLFSIYFPPVSEFTVRFQSCLWNSASHLRCLSCHTPFQSHNIQISAWLHPSNGQLTQSRAHMSHVLG